MDETTRHAEPVRRGHEERDVRLGPVMLAGTALAFLAGLTLLAMWLLFDYFAASRARLEISPSPLREVRQLPPEPRLQVSPTDDMRRMLAGEMAVLQSYGWVDRDAGIVRIPVDRAMELLVQRSIQTRDRGQDSSAPDQHEQRPQGVPQ